MGLLSSRATPTVLTSTKPIARKEDFCSSGMYSIVRVTCPDLGKPGSSGDICKIVWHSQLALTGSQASFGWP